MFKKIIVIVFSLILSSPVFAQYSKQQIAEREARIAQINEGNFEVAKNCGEISEIYIPKNQRNGSIFGVHLSKNTNQISMNPRMDYTTGYSTIVSMEGNMVYTFQKNSFTGAPTGFILKSGPTAIWFNSNIQNGKYVTFLGNYVGNKNVTYTINGVSINVTAKVIDLVCASTH